MYKILEYMNNISLLAATGDKSRPLLVAICLIISIILMIVLVITGKVNDSKTAEDEDDNDDIPLIK